MELVYGLMLTMHLGLCEDCNPVNPFIGLEKPVSDSVTLGGRLFYNSYEELGALVGVSMSHEVWVLDMGLAFGYDAMPVVPMISFGVQPTDNLKIFIAPITDETATEWGMILGTEVKF